MPFIVIEIVLLLATFGCKNRNLLHSDFQFNTNSRPICYNLTEIVLTSPPNRVAMANAPIVEYHIGSFLSAIGAVKQKFENGALSLHQGMFIEEAAAITLFTERSYVPINDSLYNHDCDKFKMFNQAIASGVNKSAALYGTFYRGGEIAESEDAEYVEGKEITAPAFLSASTDEKVANRFKRNALFEIESDGLGYIGWISSNGGDSSSTNEREVLILPGSKFQIVSVEDRQKYKFVKMKHLTKNRNPIRYPVQVPSGIQALSGDFTKSEVAGAIVALLKVFKPGVYRGKDCQFSIVQKPDGNAVFNQVDQEEVSLDSSVASAVGDSISAKIISNWEYPTLATKLYVFTKFEMKGVTFHLNDKSTWLGVKMWIKDCFFEQQTIR